MSVGGTTQLSAAFPYGTYGVTAPAQIVDSLEPFPVGTCIIIPDPSGLDNTQPFVGQVVSWSEEFNELNVMTLSTGTIDMMTYTSLPEGSEVTFGGTAAGWAIGPKGSAFPATIFWPTDATLFSPPAMPDGSGDASVAINAALMMAQAAAGGLVMLPPGTFKCLGQIVIPGTGVHLWGSGVEATTIKQGFTSVGGAPYNALVVITGTGNSVQNLTLVGDGLNGPPGAVPEPVDPTSSTVGFGWGILCAGATDTDVSNVHIAAAGHGLGAIVFQRIHVRDVNFYTDAVAPSGEANLGFYAQGPTGAQSSTSIVIGGSPTVGDPVHVALTDDLGNVFNVTYILTILDTSTALVANHVANAINASGATSGQQAFLATATVSGSTITLTALEGGSQGNDFVFTATTGGTLTVTPSGTFTGGAGDESNDFACTNVHVTFSGSEGTSTLAAFHCDGGVASFAVAFCGTRHCTYHLVVSKNHAGSLSSTPNLININNTSSDHDQYGMHFEFGTLTIVGGSTIGATGVGPPISVSSTYGSGVRLHGLYLGNNGGTSMGIGAIQIGSNNVQIADCTIRSSGVGIQLEATVTGPIQIVGNEIGNFGMQDVPIGIDLSALTAEADWILIDGNQLAGENAISLPTSGGSLVELGKHCRFTNNPMYNPVDTSLRPSVTPGNGSATQNPYYTDAMVIITPNADTLTSVDVTLPGGAPAITYWTGSLTGSNSLPVLVPCGATVTPNWTTHTGTGLSWVWMPT